MDYTTTASRFGRIARHLVAREDKETDCHPQPNIDLCEKPSSSDPTTPIAIGVIVGIIVLGTLAVLTFLHLRRKRRDEEEWPKNNQELDDYGFTAPSSTVRQPQAARHPAQSQQRGERHDTADDLERSLRGGQTTGAFRRQEEQISADMKPVEASDRV
ncbi:hypothetical protein SAMD00023353_5200790 [Rosellinia necatrix]|uniref:Uncharacterized protein n=1 Tax=Rosellinia necatrix TaxID=77044 RepID=A0A1W2TQK2_ROSNE|nr:hypothetical protein SAMD00023353_5200790 [Rosellinia necatrix]